MKRLTQKYKREDGTTFVTYCGDNNPCSVPLTASEILIEETTPYFTAKKIIQEILQKLADYEDSNDIETHGKWTKETVWIYRNDRGDIMRAQDEHPAEAVKQAEELYRKGESDES